MTEISIPRPAGLTLGRGVRVRALAGQPAAVFTAMSLLFGALLLALTPPLRGPDEAAHVLRAYSVSVGVVVPAQADRDGRKGVLLPAGLHDGFAHFVTHNARERLDYNAAAAAESGLSFAAPPHWPAAPPRDDVFVLFEGSEGYAPVPYLPYAVAAWAAHLGGADFHTMLMLMRVAGLLAATALAAWAIAIVPGPLAWCFLTIAMLPASLYGRAVVSADGLAVASALLVAAICVRAPVRRETGWPPILAACLALSALCKPPNIALMILPLMIWPWAELFRRSATLALIVAPAVALTVIWTVMSSGDAGVWRLVQLTGQPAEQFDPVRKLQFMWAHPLHFPTQALGTLKGAGELWRQLIGVLGLFDTVLRPWMYGVLTALLAAVLIGPVELPARVRLRVALVAVATALAYGLAVFVIFYLVWTPTGADQVWGVQGRYFLPALPLLAITIGALFPFGPPPSARAMLATCCGLLSGAAAVEAVLRVDWKLF